VVARRSPWNALREAPLLFSGKVARVRGVTTMSAAEVEVTAANRILYHVDGETHVGGTSVRARVHPGALKVRVANRHSTKR
jgi:diacylglycerol kinase family enzyme